MSNDCSHCDCYNDGFECCTCGLTPEDTTDNMDYWYDDDYDYDVFDDDDVVDDE